MLFHISPVFYVCRPYLVVVQELRERVLREKYRIPFYMSTDCENLLKKFLVLNPLKRASLEVYIHIHPPTWNPTFYIFLHNAIMVWNKKRFPKYFAQLSTFNFIPVKIIAKENLHLYSQMYIQQAWLLYICLTNGGTHSQGIMKDRWMNMGFDEEELKPYIEPEADINNQARIRESFTLT